MRVLNNKRLTSVERRYYFVLADYSKYSILSDYFCSQKADNEATQYCIVIFLMIPNYIALTTNKGETNFYSTVQGIK